MSEQIVWMIVGACVGFLLVRRAGSGKVNAMRLEAARLRQQAREMDDLQDAQEQRRRTE